MEMLKKFWPTPFRIKPKDVTSLVVQLVIFVVVCAVVGALIACWRRFPFWAFCSGSSAVYWSCTRSSASC